MIDINTVARIRAAADIVQVVGEFVSLRKSGANFKGLCPFHDEKTPSFMVSPAKQICKCFSCGKGGDTVKFLMEHEQLSYVEALRWLARKYGIAVEERELSDEEKAAQSAREAMFVVNGWARDFFVQSLRESAEGAAIGMTYFRQRGLRDDIIRRFQLGYSPSSRHALSSAATEKGFQRKYLIDTGLSIEGHDGRLIDRYYGRVIFPVFTVSGRVVAFGGRTLLSKEEQKAKSIGKYINSPESDIYHKKDELYGLFQAKQAIAKYNKVFLVEGYLDVISMFQAGVENVVASSGTSLTSRQVRLIHRFTENVTLLYDGDAAGLHAALRGVNMLLSEGLNIRVLTLPEGEDPDTFAQGRSPEALREYIDANETDFITFKASLLLEEATNDPIRRASAIKDIVESIAVIPDEVLRQEYVRDLSRRMKVDETTLINEINIFRKRVRDGETAPGEETSNPQTPEPAQQATSTQSHAGAHMQSASQKRLAESERNLIEKVIRYGGMPMLIRQEEVERRWKTGGREETDNEDAAEKENAETSPRARRLLAEEGSPMVAPYILGELSADGLEFSQALYNDILKMAVQKVDEFMANVPPPGEFFNTMDYFIRQADECISGMAVALEGETVELSTNQAREYIPEEQRLYNTVPRAIHELKYALVLAEKESLLEHIRHTAPTCTDEEMRQMMARISELHETERLLAKALGGRVLAK